MTPDTSRAVPTPPASISVQHLQGFFLVALHGGYARAAAAMPYPVTPPALHQQVRKLERALGKRLLAAGSARRMVPTPEGRTLLEFVRPFFDGLPTALRRVRAGEGGELVVASEPFFVDTLCAGALAKLKSRHPELMILLREMDSPEMADLLRTGQVHAGIMGEGSVASGLSFHELGRLDLALVVPSGHPLARRRPPLDLELLRGQRYVLYTRGTAARDYCDAALARVGLAVEASAEVSSSSAMRALVRTGLGPAFVPVLRKSRQVRRWTEDDGSVSFDLSETLSRLGGLPRYGLLLADRAPSFPALDEFCELLRGHAR